ncbi:MAG: hypothetical protein WC002_07185 [Candidatus Muiribacteriota bacterium]|jgi:hypothetical protein
MRWRGGNIFAGVLLIFSALFLGLYAFSIFYFYIEISMYPTVEARIFFNQKENSFTVIYRPSFINIEKKLDSSKYPQLAGLKTVTLYYLPENPEIIYLKPRLPFNFFISFLFSVIMFIAGFKIFLATKKK